MSASIDIPNRAQLRVVKFEQSRTSTSPSSSSSPGSSPGSSDFTTPFSSTGRQNKAMATSPTLSASSGSSPLSARRPSLLGSSLAHTEYTVINVAGPGRPVKLVGCVKSSQGFDWNQDIFLQSYIDCDSSNLEIRPDPVQDIILTDEEADALLPR